MIGISLAEERAIVNAIESDRDRHVVLPPSRYASGTDRSVVTRDGLRVSLHRRLYTVLVGEFDPDLYLLRACTVLGCQNPFHYQLSGQPYLERTHCRNGHEYGDDDRLPSGSLRCHICYEARLASRRVPGANGRRGRKPQTFCQRGLHPMAEPNLIVHKGPGGQARRKCRACRDAYRTTRKS